MQMNEFTNLLNELSSFYERKEPKPTTIELWYHLIKNIPSEPVTWITKKIEENYESFPKNLTAALWSTYNEWQQVYPEKKAIENYFDCPDCHEGLIIVYKKVNNYNYEYVFRCARCKQSRLRAYPLGGKKELLENGYSLYRTPPLKESDIPF
jgi:hypothetical protein